MSGFHVRKYRPEDEAVVKAIFQSGMWETLTTNMRRQRGVWWTALSLAFALLVGWEFSLSVWKVVLIFAAATAAVVGALPAYVVGALPAYVAHTYITASLTDDLHDIQSRYGGTDGQGSGSFVAVMDDTQEVVGFVAIERPNVTTTTNSGGGFAFQEGDAELRRMTVKTSMRGRGVARALFQAVLKHCVQKHFDRLVLSTSNFQTGAVEMYPKLGMTLLKKQTITYGFVSFDLHYFAMDVFKENARRGASPRSRFRTQSTNAIQNSLW
eukprot:g71708.t1